jgi:hypothetical protein
MCSRSGGMALDSHLWVQISILGKICLQIVLFTQIETLIYIKDKSLGNVKNSILLPPW